MSAFQELAEQTGRTNNYPKPIRRSRSSDESKSHMEPMKLFSGTKTFTLGANDEIKKKKKIRPDKVHSSYEVPAVMIKRCIARYSPFLQLHELDDIIIRMDEYREKIRQWEERLKEREEERRSKFDRLFPVLPPPLLRQDAQTEGDSDW